MAFRGYTANILLRVNAENRHDAKYFKQKEILYRELNELLKG